MPPSTNSVVPVTYAACSEGTHAIACAMSPTAPQRPSGISSRTARFCSGSSRTSRLIGVSIAPGATDTTRMPCGASSRAIDWGEQLHAALRRAVVAELLPRDLLVDGGDHHDRAARVVGAHGPRGLARGEEDAGEVHADDAIPLVERHVDELERRLDAGVVDHEVEAAERLARLPEAARHLVLVRDVHLHPDGLPARALDRGDH